MLTDLIKHLQGLSNVGHIDASDERPVLTDGNTNFISLERYHMNRYRERYSMKTSSIDAFVSYTNNRSGAHKENVIITSVDADNCVAKAIFNSFNDGEPGHCDDTATCTLKPLPMYAFLMSIGEREQIAVNQREVIDIIRDWHDYIPDAVKLVGGLSKLTVEGVSKASQEERDFGVERSAMERIELKSEDGEVPSDITVKMAPYDGFAVREIQIGISALIGRDKESITLRLRVRGYEALKLAIAEEFAERLTKDLTVAPIIGTIEAS